MIFQTSDLNDQSEICEALKSLIEDNIDELKKEIIEDLSHIDQRATNYTGLRIDNISHAQGNEYQLDYSYDYNIYNGCADMDVNDEVTDSLLFTIDDDGELEFDYPVYEERSTADEL
ncbi:hypothetical protein [Colwellia sp. BRX9-1]|jgi:hypothetical protein|uniref:hypothetical protein n=1 Tax=Colwellia sp. BRX9-1 TaxID=2759830 RepID=UPI0015F3E4EA|nr:hypothetical protein [Colwellia sp. BRX9-1]MBA6350496.1 hypothetical protein [Colwellia sp. BRX9-1]